MASISYEDYEAAAATLDTAAAALREARERLGGRLRPGRLFRAPHRVARTHIEAAMAELALARAEVADKLAVRPDPPAADGGAEAAQ